MVLKELTFNYFLHLGGVVVLKELIFNSFYFGTGRSCGFYFGKELMFNSFYFGSEWCSLKN